MSYISNCFYCYVIAQQLPSPTYAVAISLYQIIWLLVYSDHNKQVSLYYQELHPTGIAALPF